MPDPTRVFDLLAEWEDRRREGRPATAEELCPDDPAVREELRRRIRRQEQLRAVIEPADEPGPAAPGLPEVDGYDLLDVVGSGGMGIVYRARDRRLGRVVALKMILAGVAAGRDERARFRDEARAVAALDHPHIVQVYEAGEAGGRPYLALEYVPGVSLAKHLDGTPVGPRRAAEVSAALARAVQHAHDQGIVHRDLKPANVLLGPGGTPKVTDFGLAKRLGDDSGRTRTGAVVGSPSYMPPEQAAGQSKTIGPAADVYSLGAILYELLTGRPPFRGETVLETIRQVGEHPPVPPTALQPGIPRDLEVICQKCLEKVPADRYATAAELADDLGHYLAGEPIKARPPSVLGAMARNLRRGEYHPAFRGLANRLLAVGPFPLAAHLGVYFAFRGSADFATIMTTTSAAVVLLVQFVLLGWKQGVFQLVPPRQRRHFATVWAFETVGVVVTWLVVRAAAPPDRPDLLFLVYPAWLVQLGLTYSAFASEAGGMYVSAAGCYALAVGMAFVLPWAPLIVGGVMFLNMTASGLFLFSGLGTRRADAETAPAPPPRPPTTTRPGRVSAGPTSSFVSGVRTAASGCRAVRGRVRRGDGGRGGPVPSAGPTPETTMPKTTKPRTTFRPGLEALTAREVPAAFTATLSPYGLLRLEGTNAAEQVRVDVIGTGTVVRVTYDKTGPYGIPVHSTHYFNAAAVGGIHFNGYGGNDWLQNNTAEWVVADGGEGDDTLVGGAGNDWLDGREGDDQLYGNGGDDRLSGYTGDNYLRGGDGNDTLLAAYGTDTLLGGDGDDHLEGGAGDNWVEGNGGNDDILGDLGDDTIFGGDGNDTLHGMWGNDWIYGGAGDDWLYGQAGDDHVFGEGGFDRVNGGQGTNVVSGEWYAP
ncbi:MAG: protein kinase [Gemmataceae bacterium]|nr:protein kinase [Gemmataceae bacterium]